MSKDPFVKAYMEKGFGSMNKNDVEVWVFNDLLQGKLNGKSNYDISRALKIPESKVKRLRYEADLVYGKRTDNEFVVQLKHVLEKGAKISGEKAQFIIEDIPLRKYVDNFLKSNGRFADSSFNAEIVSVSVEDLMLLLEKAGLSDLVKQSAMLVANNRKETNYGTKSFLSEVMAKCRELSAEDVAKGIIKFTKASLVAAAELLFL